MKCSWALRIRILDFSLSINLIAMRLKDRMMAVFAREIRSVPRLGSTRCNLIRIEKIP